MDHTRKRKTFTYHGEVPEYGGGAIFMSSRATKDECIERNLFGLPMAQAKFVKSVKYGMTLFLFEFESRQLYGVFEAVSDGQLNIDPYAWSSSQKAFPAQVSVVRVIQDCPPVPELVFREVIVDNYYRDNKFHFGLSRQQVDRLRMLFIPRSRPEKPLRQMKASKRQTITSGDLRELIKTQGRKSSYHATEHEHVDSDEPKTILSGTKVEQVEDYPSVLGDYIPLSPFAHCDAETVDSIVSNQWRGGMIPRLPLLERPVTSRELVPYDAHPTENATCEDDILMNDEFQHSPPQRHVTAGSKRVSVFSRLSFA